MSQEFPELLYEIHKNLPRQGPGSNESTGKALSLIPDLPANPGILDVGCGPGQQTIELIRKTGGTVTAVDNHQPFLDTLEKNAKDLGFSDNLRIINRDMFALDLNKGQFDLIWSEGAIYIIGFEEGLKEWKLFLKSGGYMAVTEITWLQRNVPDELKQFWDEGYPAMKSIEENLGIIKDSGYEPSGYFTLPDSAWWNDYYTPLEIRLNDFRKKHLGDSEELEIIESSLLEIDLFRKYSDYYGYLFYVMRKTG